MSVVPMWKQQYFMALTGTKDSSGMTYGAYSSASTNPFPIVYLTNEPEFNPNQEIINTDKATGFPFPIDGANNDIERTLGYESPETSYEFEVDPSALFIPFVTLLQPSSGDIFTSGIKTIEAYDRSSSTVNWYSHLFRITDTTDDEQILGAVANNITVSGSEGEMATFSVDWSGASHDIFPSSGESMGQYSGESDQLIAFDDINIAIGEAGNTLYQVNAMSMEFSIANNLTSRHYNNNTVQEHILGNLDISLTLTLPFSETNADSSTMKDWLESLSNIQVVITNNDEPTDVDGSPAVGEFVFEFYTSTDNKTTESNEELDNTIELSGLSYYAGGTHNKPFGLYLNDDVDRLGWSF